MSTDILPTAPGNAEIIRLNVTFDLTDLVITVPGASSQYADPEAQRASLFEFSFDDRAVLGKTLEDLKKDLAYNSDVMILKVDFADKTERDGTMKTFHPHFFIVKREHAYRGIDVRWKDSVLLALVYKVAAQMEMMLRQTMWRDADPGIHRATLYSNQGIKLASSLAAEFLPYVPKKKA